MQQANELDEDSAGQVAELFRALADTRRVQLIAIMAEGEANVGSLAQMLGISESSVSHHLRNLRQMRLVKTRKVGRFVYYTLDDAHVGDLFRCGLEHVRHG